MRFPFSPSPQASSTFVAENERERFLEQRRRVYIIVGTIGTLMLLFYTFSNFRDRVPYLGVILVNNGLFALVSVTLIGLAHTRRVHMDLLERAAFWMVAAQSLTFNSFIAWWLNWSLPELYEQSITDDVWFLVFVCTVALHILPRGRGSAFAVSFYLLSAGAVGARVALQVHTSAELEMASIIVQNYMFWAMVLSFMFVLARYRDHGQRLELEYQILERVAFLDALTGLPNRRRMYTLAQQNIEWAERAQTPFCAALLDVDHFKRINDTFGHLRGDEALVRIAEVLRAELGSADLLGRWGGEEFLVLFPQTTLEVALTTLERVKYALERDVGVDGERLTLSGGVTLFTAGDTTTTLVGRADVALYQAKAAGRNRILTDAQLELMEELERR